MKTLLLLLLTSLSLKCCADENFYTKGFVGANFLQNTTLSGNKTEYDTGYILAGSVGYQWCNGFKLEGEYAFRRNALNKIHFFGEGSSKRGHFQTSSWMANLLWDIPLSGFCEIQPFIGAGIGYDFQQLHSSNSRVDFHQKWRHFSWQLIAGIAYPIYCNTSLTVEYKYHQGGCHFNNHAIGIGLIYSFE